MVVSQHAPLSLESHPGVGLGFLQLAFRLVQQAEIGQSDQSLGVIISPRALAPLQRLAVVGLGFLQPAQVL